jgi:hypothetical protein
MPPRRPRALRPAFAATALLLPFACARPAPPAGADACERARFLFGTCGVTVPALVGGDCAGTDLAFASCVVDHASDCDELAALVRRLDACADDAGERLPPGDPLEAPALPGGAAGGPVGGAAGGPGDVGNAGDAGGDGGDGGAGRPGGVAGENGAAGASGGAGAAGAPGGGAGGEAGAPVAGAGGAGAGGAGRGGAAGRRTYGRGASGRPAKGTP